MFCYVLFIILSVQIKIIMDLFLIFFLPSRNIKNRHFINIRYQVSNDYKRVMALTKSKVNHK